MPQNTIAWKKWYNEALQKLAQKAWDTSLVVTDGDLDASRKVYRDVIIRHHWYDAGLNKKNQDVMFCWAIRRDSTGKFRSWREVHTSTTIKRYDVAYRRTKHAAQELARKRYNHFIGAADEP
jgi:hypothetical protein